MAEKKSVKTKKQTVNKKEPKSQKKSKNTDIQNQLDQLQDKHIRLKAEFENFRKRKNKEISLTLFLQGLNMPSVTPEQDYFIARVNREIVGVLQMVNESPNPSCKGNSE